MAIKNMLCRYADKAGNAVSRMAELSPDQIARVQYQRDKYLSEIPDPNDATAQALTERLLAAAGIEIYNAYLPQLKELYIPVEVNAEYEKSFNENYNIRYLNITKWVVDKEENSLEKLINVYDVLSNEECNIALVFNRTRKKINVYLAVVNTKNSNNNNYAESYKKRLVEAIKGNFPGSEISSDSGIGVIPCLKEDNNFSIATASNIPAEKSEKFISQTIEKLLDGIVPEDIEQEYTIVLLATPIQDIENRKLHLANLYSGLAPYSSWQTNFTYTQSDAESSTATVGVNVGASAGVQSGQSTSQSESNAETEQNSQTETKQEAKAETDSKAEQKGKTKSINNSHTEGENSSNSTTITEGDTYGANAGLKLGHVDIGANYSKNYSDAFTEASGSSSADTIAKGIAETASETINHAISNTVSNAVANTLGKAVTKTVGITKGLSRAVNFGVNFGASFARSSSVTATVGKNEGITQSFTNYNIKHAMELLESQMKRYEESTALGMWDFAAYFISEDMDVANNVAHFYLALTQGEESYMSQAAINLWRGDTIDDSEKGEAKEIFKYVRQLRHPMFALNPNAVEDYDSSFLVYPVVVTATTALSGKELAYSLNFPNKSISGLPVIECASFGRNISSYDPEVETAGGFKLGSIYHMNHCENTNVYLNENSLASHAFITGSTGSGKSNTIYKIIEEARKKDIRFLVVEPAKGEYKHVFGNDEDVNVFGTNPKIAPLLKLNPFSFPKDIHVLEHIDRLVEIFNVCWPMYAAMPAVLKSAIEKSYEDCGWSLEISENGYSDDLYPSFKDVTRNVKNIIDSSDYDAENKGAYKGSLITRLSSLCNGINGLIFCDDEIGDEIIFDQNTIIDLSRVGSNETKSLMMGIIILKLQEYRMATATEMNSNLKHLTVLEEAHNLLKRTSTSVSSESSNLLGKSVEMLANAIAEMRTYGDGFIIADQAPELLDMSVIRNTNTKIIMRLPDLSDRELVGKAANLKENQIEELAKLPRGVAAIYQNEWIEPVLCKVDKFDGKPQGYQYTQPESVPESDTFETRLQIAEILSKGMQLGKDINKENFIEKLQSISLSSSTMTSILRLLDNPPVEPNMKKLAPIMNDLFPEVTEKIKAAYINEADVTDWTRDANEMIIKYNIDDQVRRDIIQGAITFYLFNETDNIDSLKMWIERGGLR